MKEEEVNIYEEEKRVRDTERRNSITTNRTLALVAVASFFVTLGVSWFTVKNLQEANKINKQLAETEYDKSLPFLVITGGDQEALNVKIQNVGGGAAKNIFFLKHYTSAGGKRIFVLTKEPDVKLALAAGEEKTVNLNEQFMDRFEDEQKVLAKIPCITKEGFLTQGQHNWVAAFYENMKGEKFVSRFSGSSAEYADGVSFYRFPPCG